MPLLDHFHSPLDERYPWESFHSGWATRIADQLSDRVPAEFVVAEHTHSGNHLEIDVATFEQSAAQGRSEPGGPSLALAPAWAPPAPAHIVPAIFPDVFEIRVFSTWGGLTLVSAIELISPGNKDRPQERRAFATKCASYLNQGVSLIVIDIVTSRRANLHNEIIRLLAAPESSEIPANEALYAVAYRPVWRRDLAEIEIWSATFAVGDRLPTLPLRLTGDLFVPVDFEASYQEACRRRRLA
ncbi:MAG TPA: DUF4058 family protein [Pirellulales bacterium]|nr:DUF4058 family protein [Pirellulales bacterium]